MKNISMIINDNTAMTNEEIERKRDPILFGVIKDSNKLYYIDEWEDELCNLKI